MLLIHVPRLTNRLGYTLNVLFRVILKTDFEITAEDEIFLQSNLPKLCYGRQKIGDGLFLRSCDLLFQTTIEAQSPRCFKYEDTVALFPVHNVNSDFPFDIFAASFYCLSRYEEYLPHLSDSHGRFPASESLAFNEGFLTQAVVDRWAIMLADKISARYPELRFPTRFFDFEDSLDIDTAYRYRNKGLLRNIVGFSRDLSSSDASTEFRKRLKVLLRKEEDPYDCFDYVIDCHGKYQGMSLLFFPLMADYNVYDKPISYQNKEFRELLQHLCDCGKMGLHASYASMEEPERIVVEAERLSSLLHRRTIRNRFHFLRLVLPQSYNVLIDSGILHDYSMGYSEEPGFRAGTGNPYPFFDLESDCETRLTIHPLVCIDSTFYHYKKCSLDEAEAIYRQIIDEAKLVGCTLSVVWHNQCLSNQFEWEGWRPLYEKVLAYADAAKKNN